MIIKFREIDISRLEREREVKEDEKNQEDEKDQEDERDDKDLKIARACKSIVCFYVHPGY